MLAFDYLKADPRQNARLVTQNWAELFLDPDCPYGVKAELTEIQQLTDQITDAVLYWHGKVMMENFTNPHPIGYNPIIWTSPWLEPMYLMAIKEQSQEEKMFFLLRALPEKLHSLPFLKKEIVNIVDLLARSNLDYIHSWDMNQWCKFVCITVACPNELSRSSWGGRGYEDYVDYMSLDFFRGMQKLTDVQQVQRIHAVADILRDTPKPSCEAEKYKTLGDVERAHEMRTETEVQKMLEKTGNSHLEYTDEFKDIVKQHEFIVPPSRGAMIVRGAQHHNCVATYADKHCTYLPHSGVSEFTRLLFTPAATIELRFYCEHDIIVAVMAPQVKGHYNKDKERTEALTSLRCHFTGKPMSILKVEEVQE